MGQVKVNADAFLYKVPNEEAGQPPIARTAYLGEVIDLDEAQEERGRAILVNRDYPYGTTTVRSKEPALVDVDHDADVSAAEAARQARVRQLQAELAALDVAEVPTVATGEGPGKTMQVDDPEARARIAMAELASLRDLDAIDADTFARLAQETGLDDEPPAPVIPASSPTPDASADYTAPAAPTPPAPPAPPAPARAAAKKSSSKE